MGKIGQILLAQSGCGWVVTIDGMNPWASFYPDWPDMQSTYLYQNIRTIDGTDWRSKIIQTIGPIVPFAWSGNLNKTDEAVEDLYERLKWLNDTNRPVTVLSHSWGTALTYIALKEHGDIHVDKLITLGSPLESVTPIINTYTQPVLWSHGIWYVDKPANLNVWHNYYTICDLIAGRISALPKQDNYVNKNLYSTITGCHSSYFEDADKWKKILQDVVKK